MTTVFRIKGAHFNNPNFPLVAPFLRSGLVGAFRPSGTEVSMVDISGAGATVSKVGSPTFTAGGLKGDVQNGYITNIPETVNQTIIVVGRALISDLSSPAFSSYFAGNFYPSATQADRRGMSLFFGGGSDTPGVGHVDLWGQSFYKNTVSALPENATSTAPRVLDNADITTGKSAATAWYFMAISNDSVGNKSHFYLPALNPNAPFATKDITALSGSLATRGLLLPPANNPNYLSICSSVSPESVSGVHAEVAEVLFYNRALSTAEIFQQYQASKRFILSARSIVI